MAKRFTEMSQKVRGEAGLLGRALGKLGADAESGDSGFRRLSNGLRRLMGDFDGLGDSSRNTMRDLAFLNQGVRGLGVALAIKWAQPLITGLISLGAVAVSVASSLGLVVAALGALATAAIAQAIPAIALLAFAFQGLTKVMEVVKLREQERTDAAENAVQQAGRIASAEERIAATRRDTADAVREVADAEEALADARIAAAQRIEDTLLREKEGVLDRKDAELSLLEAKQRLRDFDKEPAGVKAGDFQGAISEAEGRLARAQATGDLQELIEAQTYLSELREQQKDAAKEEARDGKTALDRRRLELSVEQAALRVRRSKIDERRGKEAAGTARREGVGGSPEVTAAQRRLVTAQRNLLESNKQLVTSQKDLTTAMTDETAAAKKLKSEWDKLSPAQKRLVTEIEAIQKLARDPKGLGGVRDTLLGAFADVLEDLQDLLKDPAFISALKDLAQALADAIRELSNAATTGEGRKALIQFIKDAARNVPIVAEALKDFVSALKDVALAASPALTRKLEGIANIMDRFKNWTASDKMPKFLGTAETHLDAWLKLAGAFTRLMAAIGGASAGQGLITITKITDKLNEWADWVEDNPEKMESFFRRAREVAEQLWDIVDRLFDAFKKAFDPETTQALVDFIVFVLIPAFEDVMVIAGQVLKVIHELFSQPIVRDIARFALTVLGLVFVFDKLKPALLLFRGLILGLVALNPFAWVALAIVILFELERRFHTVSRTLKWLRDRWDEDWHGIRSTVMRFWEWIQGVFWPALKDVLTFIKNAAQDIADFWQRHWGTVKDVLNAVKFYLVEVLWPIVKFVFDRWVDLWKGIIWYLKNIFWPAIKLVFNLVKDIIVTVKGVVSDLYDRFKTQFHKIGEILGNFKRTIKGLIDFVTGVFTGDWNKAWGGLKDVFGGVFQNILQAFEAFLNTFRKAWNWLVGKLHLPDSWRIGSFDFAGESRKEKKESPTPGRPQPATGRAEGGIEGLSGPQAGIYRPVPGGVYRFVEAGHPEAIIPLDPRLRGRAQDVLREVFNIVGAPAMQLGGIGSAAGFVGGAVKQGFGRSIGRPLRAAAGLAQRLGRAGVDLIWNQFVKRLHLDQAPEFLQAAIGGLLGAGKDKILDKIGSVFRTGGIVNFQSGGLTEDIMRRLRTRESLAKPDPYINPTVAARERRAAAPQTPMGLWALQGREQRGAQSYGRSRMTQMQRIAQFLPPELQELIASRQGGAVADPAAAWRNVSGAFSGYAKKQGFADPRRLIQNLLGRKRPIQRGIRVPEAYRLGGITARFQLGGIGERYRRGLRQVRRFGKWATTYEGEDATMQILHPGVGIPLAEERKQRRLDQFRQNVRRVQQLGRRSGFQLGGILASASDLRSGLAYGLASGGIVAPVRVHGPALTNTWTPTFQVGGVVQPTANGSKSTPQANPAQVNLTVNTTQADADIDYIMMALERETGGFR